MLLYLAGLRTDGDVMAGDVTAIEFALQLFLDSTHDDRPVHHKQRQQAVCVLSNLEGLCEISAAAANSFTEA